VRSFGALGEKVGRREQKQPVAGERGNKLRATLQYRSSRQKTRAAPFSPVSRSEYPFFSNGSCMKPTVPFNFALGTRSFLLALAVQSTACADTSAEWSPEQFVYHTAQAVLGRRSDDAGLLFQLATLERSHNRAAMFNSFLNSPEFLSNPKTAKSSTIRRSVIPGRLLAEPRVSKKMTMS
jgi:hypothetical protein